MKIEKLKKFNRTKIEILKNSTSLSAKIIRDPIIEKVEVALSLLIEDRNQERVPPIIFTSYPDNFTSTNGSRNKVLKVCYIGKLHIGYHRMMLMQMLCNVGKNFR